jgi:hypothetical protein
MKKQALLMGLLIISSGLAHADPEADFEAAQDRQAHEQLVQKIHKAIQSQGISSDGFGDPQRESDCSYSSCYYYLESKSEVCSVEIGSSDTRNVSCVSLVGNPQGDAQADYSIAARNAEHNSTLNAIKKAIRAKNIGDADFGDFKEVAGGCVPDFGCTDNTYYIESSAHACQVTMKSGSNEVTQTTCDSR